METIAVAAITAAAGIVGAIAGAMLQDRAAQRNAERQALALRGHRLAGLLTEVRENTAVDTEGSWHKGPFATDAWESAKGDLQHLDDTIANLLRHAYMRVRTHNALLNYDRERVEWTQGHLDTEIKDSAARVTEAMKSAIEPLHGAVRALQDKR